MGYQAKQYNKQGRAVAFIHVSTPKEQEAWLAKHQAKEDAEKLHKDLAEVEELKQQLKDTLDELKK